MVRWELLTDETARLVWDQTLVRFDDCAPFQTYAWGEYRRGLGWEPFRWAAFNEQDEVIAMMQGYLRRHLFGIGMVWSEGGPVGDLSVCGESLQAAITSTTGLRRLYCRFRCDRGRNIEDALKLSAQGWQMPWSPLTSSYSMTLDLTQDENHLLASCERNWRRNLRSAEKCNLTTRQWLDPDTDEVSAIFLSMQNLKGLEEQHSRKEVEELLKNLKEQFVLYRCDDEQGELVSLGGFLVIGGRASAWYAATTERGRKLHASYAIFWALVQHCRTIGVRSYDLAGIDPVKNPGVYRFKRATGATPVELLGEWDWASRPWLRWFGNWAIAQRSLIKHAETALSTSRGDKEQNGSSRANPDPKTLVRSKLAA